MTGFQTQLNYLEYIIQSDYSILDPPFCPIFIVWLYHIRLRKTVQSQYVTWSSVFVKTDLSELSSLKALSLYICDQALKGTNMQHGGQMSQIFKTEKALEIQPVRPTKVCS